MARVIWVEILSRGGQVVARHRCAGPELRIGRSYQSDVIIDDPAVAPDHLHVTRGEDGAILVVAASANSPFAIHGERRERDLVDGDTVLRIGHTSLRIRDETYAVPAAAGIVEPKPLWFALSLVNEFQERGERALAAIGGTSLADTEIEMKLNVSLGAAWSVTT